MVTAHLMSLMQRGFTRLFVDGQTIDLQSPDDYTRDDFKNVFVLVDRLTARADVRQRLVDSLEICFQEGHGTALIETADAEPKQLSLLGTIRVQVRPHGLRDSRTATFQFQQSLRRVSDLPGFWKHDRTRSGSGDSQSGLVTQRRRNRALDQAATRVGHGRTETVLPCGKDFDDRAFQSTSARRSAGDHRRSRRLEWSARFLRMDGNEEVQASRSCLSFEVSRLHVVS